MNSNRKTRKAVAMYRALHLQADVTRCCIPRNNGKRRMINVEYCVEMETA